MFRRTLYMYGEIIFLSIAVRSIWCNSIVDTTVAAAAAAVVAVVIIYAPSASLSHFLFFSVCLQLRLLFLRPQFTILNSFHL